jgi:hypothetical protein
MAGLVRASMGDCVPPTLWWEKGATRRYFFFALAFGVPAPLPQ